MIEIVQIHQFALKKNKQTPIHHHCSPHVEFKAPLLLLSFHGSSFWIEISLPTKTVTRNVPSPAWKGRGSSSLWLGTAWTSCWPGESAPWWCWDWKTACVSRTRVRYYPRCHMLPSPPVSWIQTRELTGNTGCKQPANRLRNNTFLQMLLLQMLFLPWAWTWML